MFPHKITKCENDFIHWRCIDCGAHVKCQISLCGISSQCPYCKKDTIYPTIQDCWTQLHKPSKLSLISVKGRDSIKKHWTMIGVSFVILFLGSLLEESLLKKGWLSRDLEWLYILIFLASLWIYFSSCVRRLHDLGRSGIHILSYFIPILGLFTLYDILAKKGISGFNKYGVSPDKQKTLMAEQDAVANP